MMKDINEAKSVLLDKIRRDFYDKNNKAPV
jgi:hypothetical protein